MKNYFNIDRRYLLKKRNFHQAPIYFNKILHADLERKKIGQSSLSIAYQILGDLYFDKHNSINDKQVLGLDEALPFYLNYLKNELDTKTGMMEKQRKEKCRVI